MLIILDIMVVINKELLEMVLRIDIDPITKILATATVIVYLADVKAYEKLV